MARTPRPSKFRAVSGPIPLSAPGPKSIACVVVPEAELAFLGGWAVFCRGEARLSSRSKMVDSLSVTTGVALPELLALPEFDVEEYSVL